MIKVIQEQTVRGCFNSTIEVPEAEAFNLLSPSSREEYLQENFLSNGHGEGANNLIELAEAIRQHGEKNVVTYTIHI